jgi:hypothetical protein
MADIKFEKTINDILPEDYKYINDQPDPNFSPRRNKAIMQECIEETDKYFATLKKLDDDVLNRIDIVSQYGARRLGGHTHKKFKDYVGRELFNQLVGEQIMQKVRIADTVNKLNKANGNTKYKNFILK